jgi:type IV fimbrial biogenesis protein FimT
MKKGQSGFTLFELLTTIAVLGILLAVGVPSFSSIIRNNRIAAATNDLVTALTFARSEAMKRGEVITACASLDLVECAGSNDWSTGWIVFWDRNQDGIRDEDEEEPMQVWPAVSDDLQLEVVQGLQSVRYTSTGLTMPVISDQQFRLMKPGYGGEHARCIQLGNTGRIFTERNECPE